MMITAPGTPLPDTFTAPMTWDAFDFIDQLTDWRIDLVDREQLRFEVQHDELFGACLGDSSSWRTRDQARAWIASRIVEVVRTDLNKTNIRRLSLQVPDDTETEPFLRSLKERVSLGLRAELRRHFDQSLRKWEADALAHWSRMSDALDQQRFAKFTGLDQLVSPEAARKAIKFVFNRMHWTVLTERDRLEFASDWKTELMRTRRFPPDEETRARALVLRAVHTIYEDHVARMAHDPQTPALTRLCIRDLIEERFAAQGWWGLIHITLGGDRSRYLLSPPSMEDPSTRALVEQQAPRLFVSAARP